MKNSFLEKALNSEQKLKDTKANYWLMCVELRKQRTRFNNS